MKITKTQLKRIIKEELKEYAMGPPMAGEPPCPGAAEPADLASEVQRLYDEWQPQTPEGQKYKDDLSALIGTPGASPPLAAGDDWPPQLELE